MGNREFKLQKWLWDERGVEVFDLKSRERVKVSWEEVEGIRKRFLRLKDGRGLLFRGEQAEISALREELGGEWKESCPCAWVAARRRSVKAMCRVFRIFFPGMILLFLVIPWLVLLAFLHFKGIDKPDVHEQCVRWVCIGVLFLGGYVLWYLFSIRRMINRSASEADEVAQEHGSREARP